MIDRIFYLRNIQQAYNNFSCFAAAFATVSLFNTLTLFFKLYSCWAFIYSTNDPKEDYSNNILIY